MKEFNFYLPIENSSENPVSEDLAAIWRQIAAVKKKLIEIGATFTESDLVNVPQEAVNELICAVNSTEDLAITFFGFTEQMELKVRIVDTKAQGRTLSFF